MRSRKLLILLCLAALGAGPARAQVFVQCPGDTDGDAVPNTVVDPKAKCMHLTAGDGFVKMARDDGKHQFTFGFSDVTGLPPTQVLNHGLAAANFPAPTITLDEGDHFYLNLTNVGMVYRPDLFDPHSVHFHGFPQAASIFDGVPESSLAINQGSTVTYYYNIVEPGTYMYHCHVEATEHMQMGMLGNLYVRPRQNGTSHGGFTKFAYNDGDGSTGYDVEYPIQIGSFDPDFHDSSETIQPLPFALMRDRYPMLNGRGYPDTVNPAELDPPLDPDTGDPLSGGDHHPQKVHTRIEARTGKRILLRISNLNVTRFNTLATLGLSMKVVGYNARLFRGPSPDGGTTPGKDLYYTTNSVTLGGGEALDVIVDTTGVTPGTYYLYTTNLNLLSNDDEDYGGMMSEIIVTN